MTLFLLARARSEAAATLGRADECGLDASLATEAA